MITANQARENSLISKIKKSDKNGETALNIIFRTIKDRSCKGENEYQITSSIVNSLSEFSHFFIRRILEDKGFKVSCKKQKITKISWL